MKCRHCQAPLEHLFLDLGVAPPSNAYLSREALAAPEPSFPLRLFVCHHCWLVQTENCTHAEALFPNDYAYFSSTSHTWLAHAAGYARMIIRRLGLGLESFVMEIASNDGYLLKNFVAAGIPCLGIEPTQSTADAAEAIGVPVLRAFFGAKTAAALAKQGKQADYIICGNNVYAHVPDINDFTQGLACALKKGGTITLEFPHLMRLIGQNQFDTVYHEHFSYLSLATASRIFQQAGLRIYDVEALPTHGGSLRIYGCHAAEAHLATPNVQAIIDQEIAFGLQDLKVYQRFQQKADKVKKDFLAFLTEQKHSGKRVAAYGAAAKGNTLLNYAGVGHDLIDFVCDAAPSKQGKYLPGSHIQILTPDALAQRRPDWVVILPWNIAGEVMQQQRRISDWGGQFVIAVPELKVLP